MTRRAPKVPGSTCRVCNTVMSDVRLELDLLMADPSRWPATVWEQWDKPIGAEIPPAMRLWGAVQLGVAYLVEHGYADLSKADVTDHYHWHVPILPTNVDELVAAGVMAEGSKGVVPNPRLNPLAYLELYQKGIDAGKKGIDLLMAYVADLEKREQPIPLNLIKLLTDVGTKLATSQAAIVSRQPSQPTLDDDEGFRIGEGAASPRIGHGRIRTIDGEATFTRDEGPKDRAEYSRRAAQEGSTPL